MKAYADIVSIQHADIYTNYFSQAGMQVKVQPYAG
jgi:hypothetical protein